MASSSKEIECLARLETLVGSYEPILDFLISENMVSKEEKTGYMMMQDKAKWLWTHLSVLSKSNKLQLLEYEWTILPVERVKITIVTDRMSKEFSFGY